MPVPNTVLDSPTLAFAWLRVRSTQILTFVESIIAMLLGFDVIHWTADQTGLTMAVVAGVINLVAYADQRSLADKVALYELGKAQFEELVAAESRASQD